MTSPRPRTALGGAAIAALLLILTWYAAFHVGFVEQADRTILGGFTDLQRPRVNRVASFIANLCDPKPYLLLAAAPVVAALIRRRPRVAVATVAILLGANVTTELLKPVLASQRGGVPGGPSILAASWPSGHATAAMALVLCAVLAAPARRRPLVAAVMAAFAIAVSYSFLALAWHYPSDVLGGFEVSALWAMVGVAALAWVEERRPAPRPGPGSAAGAKVSVAEALAPMAVLIAVAVLCVALTLLFRPVQVVDYAGAHKLFVLGAAAIAALGMTIATAVTLAVRRG